MGRRAGRAALLAGALLLGFSAILVRWSAPAAPVVVGFYRMAFALPWILALGLREGTPRPGALRRGLPWALLAGLCFTADLTLWHSALHWTTAASATLLVGLAPLWVSLFSVAVLGHRLRTAAWTGLGLALAGAALLAFGGGARVGLGRGELLGFLASFGYGGYTLGLVRARRHLTGPQAMALVTALCLLAFGLLGLARGDSFGAGFSPRTWTSLALLGLVVQAVAWWLISWGLGHVSPSFGALGLLLQQGSTVLLGWALLGERPGAVQAFGTALILGGIALAALPLGDAADTR